MKTNKFKIVSDWLFIISVIIYIILMLLVIFRLYKFTHTLCIIMPIVAMIGLISSNMFKYEYERRIANNIK